MTTSHVIFMIIKQRVLRSRFWVGFCKLAYLLENFQFSCFASFSRYIFSAQVTPSHFLFLVTTFVYFSCRPWCFCTSFFSCQCFSVHFVLTPLSPLYPYLLTYTHALTNSGYGPLDHPIFKPLSFTFKSS